MPYSETGNFTPAVTFVPDSPATAEDQNTQANDFANGLTACQTLAGLGTALANWKMGGFKLTGLANGSQAGDSVAYGQVFGANGVIPQGSVMLFGQASAPTGWTQITTLNDYALRIVSGTGGGGTGSVGLSAFIAEGTIGHALTTAELASHAHTYSDPTHAHAYQHANQSNSGSGAGGVSGNGSYQDGTSYSGVGISINNTGSGSAHAHAFPSLAYFDLIQCSKN